MLACWKTSPKSSMFWEKFWDYLRSTLDLQGADVLHATLHDVLAAGSELHTLSLEVLLVVHCDLPWAHGHGVHRVHWVGQSHYVLLSQC